MYGLRRWWWSAKWDALAREQDRGDLDRKDPGRSVIANHDRSGLLVNLLSEDHSVAGTDGKHCLQIERYGYRWFRVGGLDYLLQRSEV